MARHYHVAAASVALECSPKWLDNLLSRNAIPGVARERQGVSRRVSAEALVRLAVIRTLIEDLAIATPAAIALSERLCSDEGGSCVLPSGLSIQVDLARVRRELDRRLLDSSEIAPPPRRGRPPQRNVSTTLDG